LTSLLALALAACGASKPAKLPPLPDLPTFEVKAGSGMPGRGWDGVVEAVRRADLSAQTAGRVAAVEQIAGANTARAQLRSAEASAAEAEQNYRRFVALGGAQFVSKAQIDQARAARDSVVAARDAARAQLTQAAQQAAYTVVRAPSAGVVAAREVEPGESVAPGQPLVSVYAPNELRISVAPDTQAALRHHYPTDSAVGFDAGDLRGALWVEVPTTP
jgi:multidrug efflux pump subunit AcrA (membrane-fusion protein)